MVLIKFDKKKIGKTEVYKENSIVNLCLCDRVCRMMARVGGRPGSEEAGFEEEPAVGVGFLFDGEGVGAGGGWHTGDVEYASVGRPGDFNPLPYLRHVRRCDRRYHAGGFLACGGDETAVGHLGKEFAEVDRLHDVEKLVGGVVLESADCGAGVVESDTLLSEKGTDGALVK